MSTTYHFIHSFFYTDQLLRKHAMALDRVLLEQLVGTSSSSEGGRGDDDCGMALVLKENSVLTIRREAYGLLLDLCERHPLVGVAAHLKQNTYHGMQQGQGQGQSGEPDDDWVSRIRKSLCILLLRGLSDPDKEGMDHAPDTLESGDNTDNDAMIDGANDALHQFPPPPVIKGIRTLTFDFFHQRFDLTGSPYTRLNRLLSDLVDPSQPAPWLHYSSYLILAVANDTDKYKKPLFDRSLNNSVTFSRMELMGGGDVLN